MSTGPIVAFASCSSWSVTVTVISAFLYCGVGADVLQQLACEFFRLNLISKNQKLIEGSFFVLSLRPCLNSTETLTAVTDDLRWVENQLNAYNT